MKLKSNKMAKPFVKWAGGKKQLLKEIENAIPNSITDNSFIYIEPFVGGGALLFYLLNNYPNLEKAIINDINTDLIDTYQTVKHHVNELTLILQKWQNEYYSLLNDEVKLKEYYYSKRVAFNKRKSNKIEQSALFIFLNKTCFNGLYRVNRKNEFNVPIGRYKKPLICDTENLLNVSNSLSKVQLLNGDFEKTLNFAEKNTLFYFDPPYKPLNKTSSFTSYTKGMFDDNEQIRLAEFCKTLDKLGHNWILSNSDMKNQKNNDDFFDKLFRDFEINRVLAKRSINSNAKKRGELTELLITN